MLLNCGVGVDSWESLGLQGNQVSQSWRKSVLNVHWKDWSWSWSSNMLAMWRTDSLEKTLMLGKIEGRRRRGRQRVRWLDRHEFEQALGGGDGQGSLACCSPWGCRESDKTERLNWYMHHTLWSVIQIGTMAVVHILFFLCISMYVSIILFSILFPLLCQTSYKRLTLLIYC